MVLMEDIPKLNTALAEWLACLTLILLLPRRYSPVKTGWISAAALGVLIIVQEIIGIVPLFLWLPMMGVALLVMGCYLRLCCDQPGVNLWFYWSLTFILAEFAASVEWQLYSFTAQYVTGNLFLRGLFLVMCFGITYPLVWFLLRNRFEQIDLLRFQKREVSSAWLISLGAFFLSNVSYVNKFTPLSGTMSMEIFIIRTLVDFAGLIMLIAFWNRIHDFQMQQEMKAITALLEHHYDQYKISQESIDLIHRKYHDLKHQIGILRMEQDAEKREAYLRQMEEGMEAFAATQHTGNEILDSILTAKQLYCQQHQIQMNIVADGKPLGFMKAMDICSIFGNAIENAIESVQKLEDPEKRLIQVAVYVQGQFLMIRVENYYESPIRKEGEGYLTTKEEKQQYHGYGLRSISYVAEQYHGSLSIDTDNHWFSLRVLVPIPKQSSSV